MPNTKKATKEWETLSLKEPQEIKSDWRISPLGSNEPYEPNKALLPKILSPEYADAARGQLPGAEIHAWNRGRIPVLAGIRTPNGNSQSPSSSNPFPSGYYHKRGQGAGHDGGSDEKIKHSFPLLSS